MMMCSKCKKRPAVVFISGMQEGGKRHTEGLCLHCAKKMGLPQVSDYLKQLGIPEKEFDKACEDLIDEDGNPNSEFLKKLGITDLTDAFGLSGINGVNEDGDDADDEADEGDDNEDDNEDDDEDDSFEKYFQSGGSDIIPNFGKMFGLSGKDDDEDDSDYGDADGFQSISERRKPHRKEKIDKKRKTLETFCTNLTRRAKEGKIDRIIGRDKEINRVIQILSRRTKNNPCLIGEPGVGKTAIAEGIALRLANDDVPFRLQGKELYLLDLTALVAGTQFRGQYESRVKSLIDEIKNAGNVMLFIDEVHNLVGSGDTDGVMNAANMFKPALSRGEMQVIGATTFNEYRKHIEKDSALERRFQPVTVNEPSIDETVELLEGIKDYYEEHHKVKVSSEITKMCAVLSERYINDRFLPDKAIDLLDESCACASLGSPYITENEKLKSKVEKLKAEEGKITSEAEIDYEKLADVKMQIAQATDGIEKIKDKADDVHVTMDDLTKVIELWTGIPANRIKESELKRMSGLEAHLKERVIGQDEACELVAKAIKRTRVQLSERRRPASFIFVGPTGVGKTELVKVLAAEMFDTVEPLIRLDMSEFMEKHSVSKIIGSPPGYVGYDEAGQLTEKVRRRPYSVVLFDEIEKAHPDVMNILLQILDEGKINDAHGRSVSFENTIICMTSNAGSSTGSNGVGFTKTEGEITKERAMKGLRDFLRPEFLARVDEVIVFRPLSLENYAQIARLMLGELYNPLKEKKISLEVSDEVYGVIAKKAHGGKFGGRDIRRVIRNEIEDRTAELIIDSADKPLSEIFIGVSGDEITVSGK